MDKYEAKVSSYVNYLMNNREDAEELVQDTFIKGYHSLAQFRKEASFATWLIRIAHHNCLTYFRKKRIVKVSLEKVEVEKQVGHEGATSESLNRGDRKRVLSLALEKLKLDERSTMTLFYYNELSIQEISEVTDLTPSNVKILLHRSRKKLLGILTDMGVKESTL